MKKSALFVLGASILTLASCGGKTNSTESNGGETTKTVKVALVTDSGTLNDHNFNQTSWEAVNAWAVENGGGTVKDQIVSNGSVLTKYYQPTAVGGDFTTTERVAAIKAAADWGANFIVLPGYLFQPVVKQVQANAKYKDIHFLALDCVNQDSDNDYAEYTLQKNVSMTQYHEEQAGFMAGYGAVKEGLTNLGFIGGMAVPAVVRYGYGYIQGAERAATELNLADKAIKMQYYYAGAFASTTEATNYATSWYNAGTETIFACGGAVYNSVTTALSGLSNKAGKTWIGVDINQHADTSIKPEGTRELVLTSAMKGLGESIKSALTDWKNNGYKKFSDKLAGKIENLGINEDAVALPTPEETGDADCWGFKNFTIDNYKTLVSQMKAGKITISAATDAKPTVKKVQVIYNNADN